MYPKFVITIAFGDIGVFERQAIIPTLAQLLDLIKEILQSFSPFLI